ncbi:MAG: glycoside hydrolase family 3 C-terminal domain-containing protein [Acidobacteria bacterium]|nr:glycoside hydrolase family 3 C-terminal domain-containing protein [Acidobacteriota bacterium]
MTLEEKAYFVTGTGMDLPGMPSAQDSEQTPGAPVIGETKSLVEGAAGTTYEIPRLGITAMVLADGPAGLRISPTRKNSQDTYYCTAFPVATLLASTWDTDLVTRIGQAMGNEVLEYGVDVLLGPGMNLHRNPLCGRNFEYYSEDPLVTGRMAAAMVKGVESQGVGTSTKHFAANNAETNRNALNTIVSERALRELYLEGFRIAVEEAQPWTVMSSYNLINDVHASENPDLLTKALRDDWGFAGYVMSDWFGGVDAVAQMKAGNDLLMPGKAEQAKAIIKAVREKKLDEAELDRNIERILAILVQTPRFKGYKYSNKPDLKAHAAVARQAAAEGMVLLKNNNAALPLSEKAGNLAAFGNASYDIITGGTGSGDVNEAYSVSLVDGLKSAGFALNEELHNAYGSYLKEAKAKLPPTRAFSPRSIIAEMPVDSALMRKMASAADVALITIGRNSGEGFDRKEDNDFNLSRAEKNLIRDVTGAFHEKGKKAIVALNVGGVIETAGWRDMPDAILLTWQGGQEAGNSIADVLSGKVNPSGKLASTFPVRYQDVPSAKNFPGVVLQAENPEEGSDKQDLLVSFRKPKPSKIVYEEGIYVGYRYYETFKIAPAYEFGYGLSYTTFEYGNLSLSPREFSDKITASVDVKNSGRVAGREVVQLYLSAPARKLDKPAAELKGFAKTRLLQPGESETLKFEIAARNLASFDPATSSWIAEAGTYIIKIGASSRDIRRTASFDLDSELAVKKESKALAPKGGINEMKP